MNTFEIKGFNQKISNVLKYFQSEIEPKFTLFTNQPAQLTSSGFPSWLGQEGKMIIFEIRALIQKIPKAFN